MNIQRDRLGVYLTPLERRALDAAAKAHGMGTSRYVRELALAHIKKGTTDAEATTEVQTAETIGYPNFRPIEESKRSTEANKADV